MYKVLMVTSLMPYPPVDGGTLRTWHMCRHLSNKMDVTVFARTIGPPSPDVIQGASRPSLHFELTNVARPSLVKKAVSGFRLLFSSYPVQVGGYEFTRRRKGLASLLARTYFDLIQIEPWLISYWPLVKKTDAVTVVSFHNIESELMLRQAKIDTSNGHRLLKSFGGKRMARIEESLLHESDLSVVTTERDQTLLKERCPDARIIVAPNGVDCEAIQLLPPSDSKRILFVGTLDYGPNIDAVTHFVRNILPILRSRYRDISFQIAGSNPPPNIMRLKNEPGVQILGFVPDLGPVYQEASVCAVPLRAGGGSRLKILEAMACGRPVVSTRVGCEGLLVEPGRHLLIADEPEEFANAVGRILDDPKLGRTLIANARAFVEKTHCWKSIVAKVFVEFEAAIAFKYNSRTTTNSYDSGCGNIKEPHF